ncbi:MAG TPA: hypothetical protein VMY77_07975 [Chitinophagaceae bacterium]|nr:hypothetical protein [Chitinophagaceae bacterium]
MKKKLFTLLITGIMISISATSQTIRENIDKLAKDKETKDRAAKADVLIHKRTISDTSSATKVNPAKTVVKTQGANTVKHKKRKHKVKFKKPSK